ncbi:hypothetical protein [Conexibacter woesei]|uniref:Uncharacterized protein n=1 Tax=Conexibacter woesei (strain DSM 14684 / CCUG 47730 / CIP 108061 / JCM 11494 / NBRC 100937 / ID131577) TaxID=469383 RepID=D3FC41_CONWI|nr:hypothetical protein [Conexibacter woesei]ADB53336.1 hypothetical protein Cwoe_4924 [Conexibacter woesei DSM 14684]
MPFTTTDRLPPFTGGPGTSSFARARDLRVVAHARELASDALGGRTVWCVAASPPARAAAAELRACLSTPAEDAIAVGEHAVGADSDADVELRQLAALLDDMLGGVAPGPVARGGLSAHERAVYAAGADEGEALLGAGVRAGDVVVLHDALAAVLAEAARARGAHVIRHVNAPVRGPAAAEAWAFLHAFEHAVDAYVVAGPAPDRLAAAMPSPSHVALKEVAPGATGAGLGWRAVLADVIGEDRDEHVGGTLHARPVVAVR